MLPDETFFSRIAYQNFHNYHVFADENPDPITETHCQQQFSIKLLIRIVVNKLKA